MNKSIYIKYSNDIKILLNLFFKDKEVLIRYLSLYLKDDKEITSLTKLNTEEDLIDQCFEFNNNKYVVYKQLSVKLPDYLLKPYNAVSLVSSNFYASFINQNAKTYISKDSYKSFHSFLKTQKSFIIGRWFILPNTTLLSAPKIICPIKNIITNLNFDQEIDGTSEESYDSIGNFITNFKNYWIPSIQLTCDDTIQSNQYITFSIKAFHKDNQVCLDEVNYYIEPIQGYTPNKEIKMINGEGVGKIYALGLNPGDKLRFKINSKYWTDLAEKILTVV